MADGVLNTDVNTGSVNTDAAGLGVPEFDAPKLTAESVLWHSIQQADVERKKNDEAARNALKTIYDLKTSGWRNHTEELHKSVNDLVINAVDYFKGSGGKSWKEYNPRDPVQAKAALDIEQKINELKADVDFSNQFKQWAQTQEGKINSQRDKLDAESVDKVNEVMSMPFSKLKEYYIDNGMQLPELKSAYPNWKQDVINTSAKLGKKTIQLPNGDYSETTVNVDPQKIEDLTNDILISDTDKGEYIRKQLAKEMQATNYQGTMHDYLRDNVIRLPHSSTFRRVITPVAAAQQKEQPKLNVYDFEGNKELREQPYFATVGATGKVIEAMQKKVGTLKSVADITFKGGKNQKIEIPTGGDLYLVNENNDDATVIKDANIDRTNFEPQRLLNFDGKVMLEVTKTEPEQKQYDYTDAGTGQKKSVLKSANQESRFYIPVNQFVANKLKGVVGDEQWKQVESWFKQQPAKTGGGKTETKSSGVKTADYFLKQYGQ